MGLKQEILKLLEENREQYLSGQEIANRLSFSRTAVWKSIKALKEDGYEIDAIEVHQQIDSTNTEAKKQAMNGAPHGTVILAEEQTAGRGRLGRTFYSPKGTGIYMSMILRPNLHLSQSIHVTTSVAVAICQVIERLTNQKPQIKWVNDIYLNQQKICGILTEAGTDFERGNVEYLILGIGLNVHTKHFPVELQAIAGSLNPEVVTRNQICAHLLNEIFPLCEDFSHPFLLDEYKSRSNVLGKWITFIQNQQRYEALAEDIDGQGGLKVRLKSGEQMTLNSGEVSIRWR